VIKCVFVWCFGWKSVKCKCELNSHVGSVSIFKIANTSTMKQWSKIYGELDEEDASSPKRFKHVNGIVQEVNSVAGAHGFSRLNSSCPENHMNRYFIDEEEDTFDLDANEYKPGVKLEKLRESYYAARREYFVRRPVCVGEKLLHERHPKYSKMSSQEIIKELVSKGRVIPCVQECGEVRLSKSKEMKLLQKGIKTLRPPAGSGDGLILSKNRASVLISGRPIILEPMLTNPADDLELQNYRKSLLSKVYKKARKFHCYSSMRMRTKLILCF